MTSDSCITLKKGNSTCDIIRTAKFKNDLVNRRVMEKFAIEHIYWERHGLDWGIVTEAEVNKCYSQNVADILDYYDLRDNESFRAIGVGEKDDIILALLQRIIDSNQPLRQILSLFEKDLHLAKGSGIALFKHLLARKYISVDLFTPLNLDTQIRIDLLVKAREIGEVAL